MLRFHFLSGDISPLSYGGKWISQKRNYGEFDLWYVVELTNLIEACGTSPNTYLVSLSVVAPSQIKQEERERALAAWGYEYGINDLTEEEYVEVYHSYGILANLGEWQGNNAHKLLAQAKLEARTNDSLTFGFRMDGPQNLIGTTGWEALSGDLLAGLNRAGGE